MFQFLIPILISIVLSVISYAIMPKPKKQKPPAAQDLDYPTAEAGRPIPVPFGKVTIKGVNILWYGDKKVTTSEIDA